MSRSKIVVQGDMYETMFIKITQDQFNEIADNGESADCWEEIEDELYSDSIINGYSFEESRVDFTIEVDGVEREDVIRDFLVHAKNYEEHVQPLADREDICYLVFEKWSVGGSESIEIDGEFDPAQLICSVDSTQMPDGTVRAIASVTYRGEYLNFDSSITDNYDLYLVGLDKQRVDF